MIPLRALLIAFRASPRAALAALWASVRGMRVRARNILYAAAQQNPEYYPLWIAAIEPGKVEAYCLASPPAKQLPPIIAIIFSGANGTTKNAARTVASIRAAFGESITIYCELESAAARLNCLRLPGALGDLLEIPTFAEPDAWLLPMIAGDEMAIHARQVTMRAMARAPHTDILYWDEDRMEERKRHDPWLKPDWDELLFLARDILTGTALFRIAALFGPINDLRTLPLTPQAISHAVISLVSKAKAKPAAYHVPLILSHRKTVSAFAQPAERRAAIEAVWHEPIEIAEISGIPGALRPRFAVKFPLPKVSILIPTRNRQELLRVCMAGLLRLEYGGETEIIIIDNGSDDEATLDYLAELASEGIIVIHYPGPFNFSAMNNRAAALATGEILCLLNNDVEMHDGAWLEAMVRHAMRPDTGAVGALLQYPDGTVQHAGVSVGTGNAAGHVYRGTPIAESGHRDMHRLTRRVSAVTAACLIVRKEAFLAVGGLDESAFEVAFNDVDFCLKLAEMGLSNIFAGEAHLTHHESKSRGSDFSSENFSRYSNELAKLQERWSTHGFIDPYHHPLVMRSSEKFVLTP